MFDLRADLDGKCNGLIHAGEEDDDKMFPPPEENQHPKRNSSAAAGAAGSRSSSSSRSKKPKRPPQRGLGVEQLEKMLIQEQQEKFAATAAAINVPQQPPPEPPLPSIPIRIPSAAAAAAAFPPARFSFSGAGAAAFDYLGAAAINVPMWSGGAMDPHRSFVGDLPPDPGWISSSSPSLASWVNKITNSPSSSGGNLQMELPSNQIHCINYPPLVPSSRPFEEKNVVTMAGIKRPYPFILDETPPPAPAPEMTMQRLEAGRFMSSGFRRPEKDGRRRAAGDFLSLVTAPAPEEEEEEEGEEQEVRVPEVRPPHFYHFLPPGPRSARGGDSGELPCDGRDGAHGRLDLELKL